MTPLTQPTAERGRSHVPEGQKQGSAVKSVSSLVSAVTLGKLPYTGDTEVSLF